MGQDWELPLGSSTFYLRPSYTWQSKVYFEDDNSEALSQDAYGLVNLRVGDATRDGRGNPAVFIAVPGSKTGQRTSTLSRVMPTRDTPLNARRPAPSTR